MITLLSLQEKEVRERDFILNRLEYFHIEIFGQQFLTRLDCDSFFLDEI